MLRRIISLALTIGLIFQQASFAQIAAELNVSGYLARMHSNMSVDKFRPEHLRYFNYDLATHNFKVLLDKGDLKDLKQENLEDSTKTLLNYFLVGIALNNQSFWVNLRPDSEDQVIDSYLAQTDVGRIMLETDLQLKKDTAKLTSPETPEGREYWNRLYKKAEEIYGYDNVSIPTLTRPWIVPGEIIIHETDSSAYIYKATLKVMLEQDYLKDSSTYNFKDTRAKALNDYSSELIRELIIPKLTKEVNSSKRYSQIRQVYYSLILSRWFKNKFAGQSGGYADRINTLDLTNLTSQAPWSKTTYFKEYQKSFKDGEYNIKEPVYTPTGQVIRSYFSGGMTVRALPMDGITGTGPMNAPPGIKTGIMINLTTDGRVSNSSPLTAAGSPVSAIKEDLGLHKLTLRDIKVRRTGLSNGGQTIEYNLYLQTKDGFRFPAPITGETAAGASAGDREAFFLYDGDFGKKNPELVTDEMIKDLYPGEKLSKEEALKRMKEDFKGKGARVAQRIAEKIIIPRLINAIQTGKVDLMERYSVDRFVLDLEEELGGNKRQKLMLTGNNTTALTVAAAKVGAILNGISVRDFLSYRNDPKSIKIEPNQYGEIFPLAVLVEGGAHADFNTDWQEYMVKVYGKNYADKIRKLNKISEALSKIIRKEYKVPASVGMESAFTPPVKSNVEPIELIQRAVVVAGFTLGVDATIGLDLASSEFWGIGGQDYYYHRVEGRYSAFDSRPKLQDGRRLGRFKDVKGDDEKIRRYLALTTEEMFDWFNDLITNKKYYLSSVEDIFHQDDKKGNRMMTELVQSKEFIRNLPHEFQRRDGVVHVADDFSTTHIDVIKAGIRLEGTQVTYDEETRRYAMVKSEIEAGRVILGLSKEAHDLIVEAGSIDGVLLKLNQAGTIMEYMAAVEVLRFFGRTIVHSHRGGEPSKEDIRADVALASTTYPVNPHNITGRMPTVQLKYAQYLKERTIVHDAIIRAEEEIERAKVASSEAAERDRMKQLERAEDLVQSVLLIAFSESHKTKPSVFIKTEQSLDDKVISKYELVDRSSGNREEWDLVVELYNLTIRKGPKASAQTLITSLLSALPEDVRNAFEEKVRKQAPDLLSVSSPMQAKDLPGGIDFRTLPMTIKPMGSFEGLNLKLPQLTPEALAGFNLSEEIGQMNQMISGGIIPSGARVQELISAAIQKGQIQDLQSEILTILAEICKLQEGECCEASDELKVALVAANSV